MKNAKTVTMSTIRAHYAEKNPNGHWFDADAMKFFKTRLPARGWLIFGSYYFVSQETNPSGITKFSVRKIDGETGNVETLGEFHRYSTREQAIEVIEGIANPTNTGYLVIVGNVGTVYEGDDRTAAYAAYDAWVITSDEGTGRAAGESVTLMKNGEPLAEHLGKNAAE
ncbi:hypothetical protein BcepSauron_064 [Burkholderia phage BcepSauron]|uniref:Uncharacterized protein n=1 Tax=Burkholderia phage BcepSauron TaxID=2530033 RepID=A0A482MKZ8_9CAUD|nr:hypothetical protein H1O17_gp064 [Burkholderia phage BcepSauron]QBQ74444.1 hypothetical protein BcepSauron_064 [Burkholderia phage BcepSauron]